MSWERNRQRAKLDIEKVKRILQLYADGLPEAKIAEEFSVSQATIHQICYGATWRDVIRPKGDFLA